MQVFKPDSYPKHNIKIPTNLPKIFLGGTIDMGESEDWQAHTEKSLSEYNCIVYNPRRTDWDSSWEQHPIAGTQFYEQVDWELKAQDNSDFIIYNLLPDSKSPITLLEIGLFAQHRAKTFIVCPKEFYRYGNVKIVSELYDLKFFHNYDDMLEVLQIHLSEWQYFNAIPTVTPLPPSEATDD